MIPFSGLVFLLFLFLFFFCFFVTIFSDYIIGHKFLQQYSDNHQFVKCWCFRWMLWCKRVDSRLTNSSTILSSFVMSKKKRKKGNRRERIWKFSLAKYTSPQLVFKKKQQNFHNSSTTYAYKCPLDIKDHISNMSYCLACCRCCSLSEYSSWIL